MLGKCIRHFFIPFQTSFVWKSLEVVSIKSEFLGILGFSVLSQTNLEKLKSLEFVQSKFWLHGIIHSVEKDETYSRQPLALRISRLFLFFHTSVVWKSLGRTSVESGFHLLQAILHSFLDQRPVEKLGKCSIKSEFHGIPGFFLPFPDQTYVEKLGKCSRKAWIP